MSEVWVTNVSSGATSDGVEEEYGIMHFSSYMVYRHLAGGPSPIKSPFFAVEPRKV